MVLLVHTHHAEGTGFLDRHVHAGDRQVGLGLRVLRQHAAVVHLVDVVAGEDQHILRMVATQQVDVLKHRVGGALVPVLAHLLLRGQQVDELVEAAIEETPATLQVADQALRLVLRGDADAADAGIDAVRQREIENAEFPPEGHRRLRAPVGQLHEPAATTTGEDDGVSRTRQMADETAL